MPNRKIDGRRIKSLRNFTIGEAAERLSVHKRTVQGWIKAGLPCMKERRPHQFWARTCKISWSNVESRRAENAHPVNDSASSVMNPAVQLAGC